jgi:hypothetical protein
MMASKSKIIWVCVECHRAEVHNSDETTEEWEDAYAASINAEDQETLDQLIGDNDTYYDVWGAICPDCKVKKYA